LPNIETEEGVTIISRVTALTMAVAEEIMEVIATGVDKAIIRRGSVPIITTKAGRMAVRRINSTGEEEATLPRLVKISTVTTMRPLSHAEDMAMRMPTGEELTEDMATATEYSDTEDMDMATTEDPEC
jgi:hypothetical protein